MCMYFLYDFINRNGFEIGLTGTKLTFEYLGNQYKFYTPESFTSPHDIHDAISWLKTNEVFLKDKDNVFPLEALRMPQGYNNGDTSDLRHLIVGLAIIAKLYFSKKSINQFDVINVIKFLSERIRIGTGQEILVSINLDDKVLRIVKDAMYQPMLKDDIRYACSFVNSRNVSANLDKIMQNKYVIKLIIGENRGITTNDVKVFQSFNGNFKEIKLANRAK